MTECMKKITQFFHGAGESNETFIVAKEVSLSYQDDQTFAFIKDSSGLTWSLQISQTDQNFISASLLSAQLLLLTNNTEPGIQSKDKIFIFYDNACVTGVIGN